MMKPYVARYKNGDIQKFCTELIVGKTFDTLHYEKTVITKKHKYRIGQGFCNEVSRTYFKREVILMLKYNVGRYKNGDTQQVCDLA